MSWFRRRKLPPIERQEKPTVSIIDDRRFRVDIPYILPKDFPEHDRLTFQHHFLKIVLGSNFVVQLYYSRT